MTDGPVLEQVLQPHELEAVKRRYVYEVKTGQLARSGVARDLRAIRRRIRAVKPSFKRRHYDRLLKMWAQEAMDLLLLDEDQLPPSFERYGAMLLAAGRIADAEMARYQAKIKAGQVASNR